MCAQLIGFTNDDTFCLSSLNADYCCLIVKLILYVSTVWNQSICQYISNGENGVGWILKIINVTLIE